MGLFLVFNLILPIWKNKHLQLTTRVELLARSLYWHEAI